MKLHAKYWALLTPLERKIYQPLLVKDVLKEDKRDRFIEKGFDYQEGDENVLPFPERSKLGVMLLKVCQELNKPKDNAAVILKPKFPHNTNHVKRKMLALGAKSAYALQPSILLAAIYGEGKAPFKYYRDQAKFTLPGLSPENNEYVVCAVGPPASTVSESSEYDIHGILIKVNENTPPNQLPLFTEAAKLGLIEVTDLDKRLWLSK